MTNEECEQAKESRCFEGTGDEKSICLLFREHGIGDDIHAMPAVQWLVDNGFAVTVYARPFARKCWESVGATFFDIRETFFGWVPMNAHKYGKIYSLSQWSVWDENIYGYSQIERFQYFAELIEAELPTSFSWIEKLQPKKRDSEPYVLYAPESTGKWRTMRTWKHWLLYYQLRFKYKNLVWVGYNNGHRCDSFQEMIDLVFNAELVIGMDSAILTLAIAFGVKFVGLFGFTGYDKGFEQFKRYIPINGKFIQGDNGKHCISPCYGSEEKGFRNNKCCGHYDYPKCLETITLQQIGE